MTGNYNSQNIPITPGPKMEHKQKQMNLSVLQMNHTQERRWGRKELSQILVNSIATECCKVKHRKHCKQICALVGEFVVQRDMD